MTFEEARAQFPVLERIAYLNAGTFGPLATVDPRGGAARARARRRGGPQRDAVLHARRWNCASRPRARSPRSSRPIRFTSRSPSSTTDGCNIVLAGLGLGPDDEIVTTTDEHFGLLGAALRLRRPGGRRRARARRDPCRGDAADAPAGAVAGALDDRARPARARVARGNRDPRARRRCAVGRRDPRRCRRPRLPHDLGPEVAVRPGFDGRAGRGRSRPAAGRLAELLLAGRPTSRTGRSCRDPAPPGSSPNWWPASSLAGLLAALETRAGVGVRPSRAVAERCRELLSARVEVVTPDDRSTLVAFRAPGDPPSARRGAHRRRCARPRDPGHAGSSGSRAAGGRPTTTSSGCWRRCPREARRAPARAAPFATRSTGRCGTCSCATARPAARRRAAHGPRRPRTGRSRRRGRAALAWERAAVSEHGASRGRCRTCGTVVFWDAPGRETVSFAAATLADARRLEVAAHIWVPEERGRADWSSTGAAASIREGLPASMTVRWREREPGDRLSRSPDRQAELGRRSAAAPRRRSRCARRARGRAARRRRRPRRGARPPRTTAASASCAPTSARAPRARSAARARMRARTPRARRRRRASASGACRAGSRGARRATAPPRSRSSGYPSSRRIGAPSCGCLSSVGWIS